MAICVGAIRSADQEPRDADQEGERTTKPTQRRAGLAPRLWRGIGSGRSHLLEPRRACEVERGMAPDGVVEAVDVSADGLCGFGACFEGSAPGEFGFQRLEERLDHGVVEGDCLKFRVWPVGRPTQSCHGPGEAFAE